MFIFIVKMLMTLGGGNVENLKKKLISIGFHGNNVFQGSQVGVTTLMKEIMASFMIKNALSCSLNQPSCVGPIKTQFGGLLGSPTSRALYEFLSQCSWISKVL